MNTKHPLVPILLVLLVVVLVVPTALAGDDKPREKAHPDQELREIMEGLERGIRALRALDRPDEAERLLRIARDVGHELEERAQRREGAAKELAAARHELEVYRIAMHALREAERKQEMAALERVIHAVELSLEGKHPDKARAAWKKAPGREGRIEILLLAGEIWRKFERAEKAEICQKLARHFQEQSRKRKGHEREREIVRARLEVLRFAMKAMLEAERRDAAEMLEHAIHARELALEGRRDEKAKRIRESAPKVGQLAELLHAAARIWDEFGHEGKAARCRELSEEYGEQARKRAGKEHERADREHRDEDLRKHIEHLHHRMEEMTREMERLRDELEELRRRK